MRVGAGRWACGSGVDAELSAAWERGYGTGRCVGRGEAEGENGSGWARVGSERAARFGVGKRRVGHGPLRVGLGCCWVGFGFGFASLF